MRVVIVDDEPHARAKLRRMLAAYADVEVVGEAEDGVRALLCCAEHAPDAVFLDMQMPELDGFGVIAKLRIPRPLIVLVTAFEQHALHAFDADVTDYLLKPVDAARLDRAVQRLRASRAPTLPSAANTLLVSDRGKTVVIEPTHIEWIESADNYVHVHASGTPVLVRRTLVSLLGELGSDFAQVHRRFAVRLDRVALVRAGGRGNGTVVLASGRELPCGRLHRPSLLRGLQERAGH